MNERIRSKMVQVLSLLTVATVFFGNTLLADDGNRPCSNSTLNGSYGLHATGTITGVGPFAAVGRFTFDGKGHLTGKLFVRVNGNNIGPNEFTGTYSVNADCTVSDNWGGSTHVSIIVNEGREYFVLNNTPGEGDTISGEARKQFH